MQSGLRYKLLSKYQKAKAHETLYIEVKTTIENIVCWANAAAVLSQQKRMKGAIWLCQKIPLLLF